MTELTSRNGTTHKPRRMAREPNSEPACGQGVMPTPDVSAMPSNAGDTGAKRTTKTEILLGLLQREEGATLNQMVAATCWLPHTTRAALTGLKKGHEVTSEKIDGLRTYRIMCAGGAA